MDYDSYKFARCEIDYDSGCNCKKCDKSEATLEAASYYLEKVLKHLYSKDALEKADLVDALDNLCYELNVKTTSEEIQVDRSKEDTFKSYLFHSLNALNQVT
jgi:hypothetical protein